MDILPLNGAWEAREVSAQPTLKKAFKAEVPGCVHLDLRRAKLIPDPYYRDNERAVAWIGNADWAFARTFTAPEELLGRDRVTLRAHGLDTLATITLNGHRVAATDNQFRTYEWDVKKLLKPGRDANTLEVTFAAAAPYCNARDAKRHLFPGSEYENQPNGRGWIRKSQCNFGWDWGPVLVTAGIWRDIELVAFDVARLADVRVSQTHRADHKGSVTLRVDARVEYADPKAAARGDTPKLGLSVVVADPEADIEAGKGKVRSVFCLPVEHGAAHAEIVVDKPQLWWPAGMGEQPLYTVMVELAVLDNESAPADRTVQVYDAKFIDGDGACDCGCEDGAHEHDDGEDDDDGLDYWSERVGLRTLRLVREPDQWGESFHFEANGRPFYAKGANWIPADTFPAGLTDEHVDGLLTSAVETNMNMLRVWGGGLYESDFFYDRCDELGLCVWQDFMFACGAYPSFDKAWMENVRAEAVDNVRRLRHHACMALYCGNNELEQYCMVHPDHEERDRRQAKYEWADYLKLFDGLLPEVIAECDPGRDYIPSSEHTPGAGRRTDTRNPDRGDGHLWNVWHGRQPFEWYRTAMHRFCSEFGFQSFPEPRGVDAYTAPGDRNITSPVMEWHQRSGIGNSTIMHYMMSWFRMPTGFENTLWLSQLQQGMAIKYAVEHWRRNMPRCMGALYWQLNDCWPVASWASLDWTGRWKALQFAAKKFFAPLLVSGVEDPADGTVDVHVTSDDPKARAARVDWTVTDTAGKLLAQGGKAIKTPKNGAAKVLTVDAAKLVAAHGAERLLVWLELRENDDVVSANLVHFVKPKHMALEAPRLAATVKAAPGGAFAVTVKAAKPALWAWAQLEGPAGDHARWSDNFFSVRPGLPVTVTVTPAKPMTLDAVKKALVLKSLYETSI